MKTFSLNIKIDDNTDNVPAINNFYKWINHFKIKNYILINIKIVNLKKIKNLNNKYKNIKKKTNVITFDLNFNRNENIMGDIIFCAKVIKNEAKMLKKPIIEHWKHLTIHSILHLKGYTHSVIKNTLKMELIEEKIIYKTR